jgi:hypothetical protein
MNVIKNQMTTNLKKDLHPNTLIDLPVSNEQADQTRGGAPGERDKELDIIFGSGPGTSAHIK